MSTPVFGVWPLPLPIPPPPTPVGQVLKGYALISPTGVVLFTTPGLIASVGHVALSGAYDIGLQGGAVSASNEAHATMSDGSPSFIDCEMTGGGSVIHVNTYNAGGAASERQFVVSLMQPQPP